MYLKLNCKIEVRRRGLYPPPATPLYQGLHIKLTGISPFTPVNIKKVVTMKIL